LQCRRHGPTRARSGRGSAHHQGGGARGGVSGENIADRERQQGQGNADTGRDGQLLRTAPLELCLFHGVRTTAQRIGDPLELACNARQGLTDGLHGPVLEGVRCRPRPSARGGELEYGDPLALDERVEVGGGSLELPGR
jgi:hypothetical protein